MSIETYKIVFQGRIRDGFSIDAVKNDFARIFKTSSEKTDKMFSGRPIIIQSNLSREKALKYEKAIRGIGAECQVLKDQPGAVAVEAIKTTAEDSPAPALRITSQAAGSKKMASPGAQADFSAILESYRPKCAPPDCYLTPDIPASLLDEIGAIWGDIKKDERLLAWFEVIRYPDKVYGLLLTDKQLRVRSITSGKRSIPIEKISQIKIVQKGAAWDMECGVSNLLRNIPQKKHEPLEKFLALCFETAGLKPQVEKRIVTKTKSKAQPDEAENTRVTLVIVIAALVATAINMDLLISAGADIFSAFIIGFILILLTPTVIGLIIGCWFVSLLFELPTFALVWRSLLAVLVATIVALILAYPLGLMKSDGEKKE